MNRWTNVQHDHARNQGWGIFAIDGDQNRLEIQKDDEKGIFESDEQALFFVIAEAVDGDMICRAALDIVGIEY